MYFSLSLQLSVAVIVNHVDPGHRTETWDNASLEFPSSQSLCRQYGTDRMRTWECLWRTLSVKV